MRSGIFFPVTRPLRDASRYPMTTERMGSLLLCAAPATIVNRAKRPRRGFRFPARNPVPARYCRDRDRLALPAWSWLLVFARQNDRVVREPERDFGRRDYPIYF